MSSARGGLLSPPRRRGRPPAPPSTASDIRRRTSGTSVGGFPLTNVVVLEAGAATALILLAAAGGLWPVSAVVVALAVALGCTRWHGRWIPQWIVIVTRFLSRTRVRRSAQVPSQADVTQLEHGAESKLTGPDDARVALLRLLVDDLVIADGTDHEQQPVGLAWHKGTWTAALRIDPIPAMVSPVGAHTEMPLAALADCLQDRGVVLDGIGVMWHCYPGSSRLPADSAAVAAYNEVLGPLPAVAHRSTWVTVRLDPRRCPSAVRERGGGVAGAHRALLGALSRVRGALELAGLSARVLSTDELLRAAISAAELSQAAGRGEPVELHERWRRVHSGGIAHTSYGIGSWPSDAGKLDSLTSIRALSTTVSLALSPAPEAGRVGMRGVVRVSARTSDELQGADDRVRALSASSDIRLERLNGQQAAAIAATLPIGGAA